MKAPQPQKKFFQHYLSLTVDEKVWGILFFVFLLCSLTMSKKIYELLITPEFLSIWTASFDDYKIILMAMVLIWIFRDLFTYYMKEIFERYIDNKVYPTPEERKERAFYLCKFALDFLYYSFSSLTSYYILKDSDFLPFALLGKGDIKNIISPEFPKVTLLPNVKIMHSIQLGYHLYSFIYQILKRRSNTKFLEFVLHHGLTIFLIAYSYFVNFINLGMIILILHDCSDSLLSLARGYTYLSFRNSNVSTMIYLIGITLWIYTRLYVLPVYGIWPTYQQMLIMDERFKGIYEPLTYFFLSMLMTLLVMNIYWSIYLVKAVLGFLFVKKIKVDYNTKERKN